MAKKQNTSAEAILADARYIHARGVAHLKDFERALKHLGTKPVSKAWFSQFLASIRAASTGMTVQSVGKQEKKTGTATEAEWRSALYDLVIAVRNDVAMVSTDLAVQKAFGRGRKLRATDTPGLVAAAADFAEAARKPAYKKVAHAAGLTSARVAEIVRVRRGLTSSSTSGEELETQVESLTADKQTQLETVRKSTAHVRTTARRCFRGKAKLLAEFARRPAIARRVKSRTSAKKKTPPKAPPAPPTT